MRGDRLAAPAAIGAAVACLAAASMHAFAAPGSPSSPEVGSAATRASPERPVHLALATHFPAHGAWTDAMSSVLRRPDVSSVALVAVSAGRPEWTYFRWTGHEGAWAAAQRAQPDLDLLRVATGAFHQAGFRVAAIVDVEAPRFVEAHPDTAAVDARGVRSKQQVGLVELVSGEYGALVRAMVEDLSARYDVDVVEITELRFREASYGERDLRSFRGHSGAADWPRDRAGAIDNDAPALWAWKSALLSGFLRDLARIVHRHRKQLFVDVPVSWRDIRRDARDAGLEYGEVLRHADRIVVWDYFGLERVPPSASEELARHLAARLPPERFYVSLGLWREGEGGAIEADALGEAARAAIRGGATQLWVTPNELVGDDHWSALLRAVHPGRAAVR